MTKSNPFKYFKSSPEISAWRSWSLSDNILKSPF